MAERKTPFADIEELFEEFITLGPKTPPLDVVETDDAVTVYADLPGRDADRIEVSVEEGRRLTIEASRRRTETEETGRYLTQERTAETVSRSIPLPAAVDEEGTSASYDDGVLTVTLPKERADGEGTQIPVE